MIPLPPTPLTVALGLSFALQMALGREDPNGFKPKFEPIWQKAIWDALWVRFMLLGANGVLVLGLDHAHLIPLLLATSLVDTLSYPVIAQFALQVSGMAGKFPLFIMCMTLVGNLRIILVIAALLATGGAGNMAGLLLLAAIGVWMIWATWLVASRSLGYSGWLGFLFVLLMMFTEILNAGIFLTFVHPLTLGGQG